MKKRLTLYFLLFFCGAYAQKHIQLVHDGYTLAEIEKIMARHLDSLGVEDGKRAYKSYNRWHYNARFKVDERGNWKTPDAYEYYKFKKRSAASSPAQSISNSSQSSSAASAVENYPCNFEFLGPSDTPRRGVNKIGVGRLNYIAFHPTLENTFYVGAAQGGIWRTNNGGYNWSNITEFVENLGVSDIEIDPNNPDVIYWLSVDYDGSDVFYTAIFKSTDGGNSWQEIDLNNTINPLSHQTFYSTILVHPDNSNIVMVAGNGGIYRSTNAGDSFIKVENGQSVCDMKFHPTNPDIMYAYDKDNRFLRSTNGGVVRLETNPNS